MSQRRSAAELENEIAAITGILDAEDGPITVRHLFYRLVGLNVIEKTEKEYKLLCYHLARWRKDDLIPWDSFTDSTRWHICPPMFDGVADALQRTRETYRRNLWTTQPYYVEVWVEKDAIAGVIAGVTRQFGVPLFVCRGFASLSSQYSASTTFKNVQAKGKEVIVYHLGDYDPSGHSAADAIENTVANVFDCEIEFKRLAILPEHISQFDLPTRPVKQSDSRARNWTGTECVELDAMPPNELRWIVENAISDCIDDYEWEQMQKIERAERETLTRTLAKFVA
jgi:hypothetical protein